MPILISRGRRSGGIAVAPTVPDAPVLVGTPGNALAHLSWTIPADNGSGITSFNVYRGGVLIASQGGTTFDDTGRTNGSSYSYRVSAVNGVGEGGQSNLVTVIPVADVPSAPVLGDSVSSARVDLTWTAPANGGATITNYKVYRNGVLLQTVGAVLSLSDLTVVNGTTYTYRVTAVNSSGEGALSNQITASPTGGPGTPPSIPADITAAASASKIIVWGLAAGNIAPFVVTNMNPLHFGGFTCGTGTLRGYGGSSSWTADPSATFNATDGRTGAEWTQQSLINSRGWVATAHAAGMKVYLGYHFFNSLSTVNGAFMLPDVWDDAAWNTYLSNAQDGYRVVNLYAAARWMGFDGVAWDMEPTPTNNGTVQTWMWNYTGNTHNQAQTRAQVRMRAAQFSAAAYGASGFPGAETIFYADNSSSPSDANALFGGGASSGSSADTDPREINDFLDGLATVAGYGQMTFVDPIFYKPNYLGGSANFGGYAQFAEGHTMARISQNYDRPDLLLPKFNVSPFLWFDVGTGGSEPEVNATDANVMAQAANKYGMNGQWALYQQHLWGASGMDNPAQYSVKWPTALTNGSAVSTVNNVAPSCTTPSQNRVGTTVTLTFTAASPHQIRYVPWRLYASDGTTVLDSGVATMIYQANGGTPAAGFDNASVDCTVTVPNGTAGLYVIVDVYTCKGQRTSRRVPLA